MSCLSTHKDTDPLPFLGTVLQPSSAEGPQSPNQAGSGRQSAKMGRFGKHPHRIAPARELRWMKTFYIKASPGHL